MLTKEFLTVKEAALQYDRSEQTIRQLVKQYKMTIHVRSGNGLKRKLYQVSQVLLQKEYGSSSSTILSASVVNDSLETENQQLRQAVTERDRIIQQLQNRLFEHVEIKNALDNQLITQKMNHLEDLLHKQNELLKQLLTPFQ